MRILLLLTFITSIYAQWHTHNTDLPMGISDMLSITVDNNIYIAGGCTALNQSSAADYYGGCGDYVNNTMIVLEYGTTQWKFLTPMPRLRYRYAAAAVGPLIYYVGGRTINDVAVTLIDVFNTTSRTWFTLPQQTCNCIPLSDSAAFSIGDQLYVSGGYTGDNYQPLETTVVLNTSLPLLQQQFRGDIVPNRTWANGDNGAVTVNGIGYVMGGFATDVCSPLTTMSAYDPKTNKWTDKAPYLEGRGDFGFGVIGNYIYVVGGETKVAGCTVNVTTKAKPVKDVERYNILTNTWEEYTPIAIIRFRFPVAVVKDEIYDIGGQGLELTNEPLYPIIKDMYVLNVTEYDIKRSMSSSSSSSSGGNASKSASMMVTPQFAMIAMAAIIVAAFL